MTIVSVAVGGALGAMSRHIVQTIGTPSIWKTWLINMMGAFLLGIVAYGVWTNEAFLLFVATGFLASFTTFSTVMVEWVELLEERRYGLWILYASLTVGGGFVALTLGALIGQWLIQTF